MILAWSFVSAISTPVVSSEPGCSVIIIDSFQPGVERNTSCSYLQFISSSQTGEYRSSLVTARESRM